MESSMKKINIFVSYSHDNADWVDKEGKYKLIPWLEKQLNGQAEIWTDHALKKLIGEKYSKLIAEKILGADIALLLISQNFVTSPFIVEKELPLILAQYEAKKIKIVPLLISNLTQRGKERIKWIFDLQTYPNDTKPLIEYYSNDAEWENMKVEILDGIEHKIDAIQNPTPSRVVDVISNVVKSEIKADLISAYVNTFKTRTDPPQKWKATIDPYTQTVDGNNFVMIAVEGGTAVLGSDEAGKDEMPIHRVQLADFYICKTQVTQSLWFAVMGYNPSSFLGAKLPVENVSWNDAQNFLNKLNRITNKKYRLPTEAEWEYAARGGNRSKGFRYSGSNQIDEVAWYVGNSRGTHHVVETKNPNELGIYGMSGNVWEWCNDWLAYYNVDQIVNPQGPGNGSNRVRRGGAWNNIEGYCTVSYRFSLVSHNRGSNNCGFRIVESA